MGITIPSETDIGAPALNRARTRSKVSHKSGENCKCAVRVANKISLKQVGADITAGHRSLCIDTGRLDDHHCDHTRPSKDRGTTELLALDFDGLETPLVVANKISFVAN